MAQLPSVLGSSRVPMAEYDRMLLPYMLHAHVLAEFVKRGRVIRRAHVIMSCHVTSSALGSTGCAGRILINGGKAA